jgi:hypothetical protein
MLTITGNKATAGAYIADSGGHKAGELSCTGYKVSGECWTYLALGATVTLTATINAAIPQGDKFWISYAPGYASKTDYTCVAIDKGSGNCILAETTSKTTLEATVKLPPDKSQTHSTIAIAQLVTPTGYVARALGLGLCDASKGEKAPNC